jgi:hypothetical protein
MGAFEAPVGGQRIRLPAGTTIADTKINALPGDVICPALCSTPTKWLTPLDSTALSAMLAAGFNDAQIGKSLAAVTPTGADSIR